MKDKSNTWFFIINPASGNGKAFQKWNALKPLLQQADIDFEFAETQQPLHAIELVEQATKQGYCKFAGLGGDGTNNEIINGILCQKNIPSSEIKYTLFPVGTGNDWVKHHNIPNHPQKWVTMLQNEHSILHDAGKAIYYQREQAQTRYFINVAGMAYDGFVGKALSEEKGQTLRKLKFLYLSVACLFQYNLSKARVEFDDEIVEDYFYLVNAGICKYSGGGMQMVPHSESSDGKLAITLARNLSKFDVIKSLPLLYNGKIEKHPLVTLHQTKKIKITSLEKTPTLLEVDGEFLGETPIEISIVEDALQVVVPNSLRRN